MGVVLGGSACYFNIWHPLAVALVISDVEFEAIRACGTGYLEVLLAPALQRNLWMRGCDQACSWPHFCALF